MDGIPDTNGKGDADRARELTAPAPPAEPEPDTAVEGSGATVLLVDSTPDAPAGGVLERIAEAQRRPLVAGWARSREQVGTVARWAAGNAVHTVVYHLLRAPIYAARLAGRAPHGAAYGLAEAVRWVFDAEGAPARRAAVIGNETQLYLRLSAQRDSRVQGRALLAMFAAGFALWMLASAAPAARWALILLAVGLAGTRGAPADRPLIERAVLATKVARLTSEMVVRALGALGIALINSAQAKGGDGISFPSPITRDGPGWRADVDLPHGVTVTDIIERRDRLASGLRRPIGCVWPEAAPRIHAGRLVLWVGDEDMAQARQAAWPLTRAGEVDLFRPVPFGTDQRGRQITATLMFTNVLIGAMPGAGKTFALRVLLLAAALDTRAELRVFELKGSGDLGPLERVAHRYASGVDDHTIEQVMESLREVYRDLERRARVIRELPRDQAPENKVTPALAARRALGLHPLVVAVDECQELFSHPVHGKEAGELATTIIKRGRALGVVLLLATQRPDKDSLPTGVSANVGVRFCLRVMGQVENDMVLGTSAYRNGTRATTFTADDLGIGYLVGAAASGPQIVRSAYLDGPAAEKVCLRARALRSAAGTLSGHALGETPHLTASASILDDVLAVVPAGEDRVWSETVAARLADLRPDTYTGWGAEQLSTALKPHGIATAQVWGTTDDGRGANRRGIDRAHITDAVTARNRNRDPG